MKDKKMIEEMAKEIFNTCSWRFGKPDDYKEIFNDIAEDLIKLNYRKLPEDSVVLTREEYSDYLILQQNHEFIREKAKKLQVDNERLYKNLGKFKELTSKETAEKIFNNLLKEFDKRKSCGNADVCVYELAKQFGVEIGE